MMQENYVGALALIIVLGLAVGGMTFASASALSDDHDGSGAYQNDAGGSNDNGQSANGHNGNGHNGNGHNGGGSNDNGQSNDVTAAPGNGLPYADGNIRIEYLDHGTYRFIALNGEEDTIWEFPVAGMLGLTYVGPVLTIDLNPYTIYMLVYKTNVYYLCTMDNTVEKIM